ncbi:Hypothetical protein PBC10988_0030 [Planctomycetales bacterium 10988]|nr:Hypothetical protein PBC10988_0030 [Planctomycetales bacterium 10988]
MTLHTSSFVSAFMLFALSSAGFAQLRPMPSAPVNQLPPVRMAQQPETFQEESYNPYSYNANEYDYEANQQPRLAPTNNAAPVDEYGWTVPTEPTSYDPETPTMKLTPVSQPSSPTTSNPSYRPATYQHPATNATYQYEAPSPAVPTQPTSPNPYYGVQANYPEVTPNRVVQPTGYTQPYTSYQPVTPTLPATPALPNACCDPCTPQVTYSPPVCDPCSPVAAPVDPHYVGRGLFGSQKLYIDGQPVRNFLRFLTF